MKTCRICTSSSSRLVGIYKPYSNMDGFEVYDCPTCGCRFTTRESIIHEAMHASQASPYAFQEALAQKMHGFFSGNKEEALRKELQRTPKFKFVLDRCKDIPSTAQMLEVGCSLGYLTAYFILKGYPIMGVDVSPTAVQKATAFFGEHFQVLDETLWSEADTFDIVYHVGTIGCVEDPLQFTHHVLDILKPGGRVLFNAPDVKAAKEMGALWNNATPPPDLITLFDERFWIEHFSARCQIQISYHPYAHTLNAQKHLHRLHNQPYLDLTPRPFFSDVSDANCRKIGYHLLPERIAMLTLRSLSFMGFIRRYKAEFGMFVILTKK